MAKQFTAKQIQQIEQLALDGCQNNTIATITGIALNTIKRRFNKLVKKKRAERKHLLRSYQTKQAEHNATMAIWLGKQELGQVDKQTITNKTEIKEIAPKDKADIDIAAKTIKMQLSRKTPA